MEIQYVFNEFYIIVDEIHSVYVREFGNPKGIPVLFLHGGPGVGILENDTKYFDPESFRVILIDQRGSGKSKPLGCIENNTIDNLVSDIEKIRLHLEIHTWHVFGGSWGSTLALYYAIKHRNRCISLILRGICLFQDYDINWWLYGVKMIFPDAHSLFTENIDESSNNLLDFYYDKISETLNLTKWNFQWFLYEMSISKINYYDRLQLTQKMSLNHDIVYSSSRIMIHFFKNCRPNILKKIKILDNLPIFVIHGRFDIVCPLINAFNLKKAIPHIELVIAETSGHSASEVEILDELKKSIERIKITGLPVS